MTLLANAWVKERPVTMFLVNGKGPNRKQLSPNVKIVDAKGSRLFLIYRLKSDIRKMKGEAFVFSALDLAHAIVYCALVFNRYRKNIRWCLIHAGMWGRGAGARRKVLDYFLRRSAAECDKIVANSRDTALSLQGLNQDCERKIEVVGNPVLSRPGINRPIGGKTQNQRPKGAVVIAAGRLVHDKGFDLLIRAFARLARDGGMTREASLTIYGEGKERRRLERIVVECGLENVRMPGYVENLGEEIANSDFLVVPSRTEGFGNVIVEALQNGVPVLATTCKGGPKEIIKSGQHGVLVEAESEKAIAEGIKTMMRTEFDKCTLEERGAQYCPDIVAREFLRVIQE